MADKLWKQTERKLAKLLGGKRVPVHSTSGIKCDVSCAAWSVEVKERKQQAGWFLDAMRQACQNCEEGKLPLLILHKKGARHDTDIVCILLKDFLEWYG